MKKVFFLAVIVLSSMFFSCEKGNVEETNENVTVDLIDNETDVQGKWGIVWRCYYIFERGLNFRGNCYSQFNGVCGVKRICIPIIVDPCWIVPCWIDIFDPWIIYEKIDPRDFLSFRDKLELDIDPRETAMPFALNEEIAGLQFYQEEGLFKDNVFTVKDSLILDAETSKELGLHGNVVKAGEYPVIHNKENGTYNVILAVEKGFER
ncbi:hypothetical protein [uncultured Aquimarina sp.]|uniref:hypothetical protein n=1 Tax=uncultured Aquimarina sp. TaxID=575652 RepID=UPI00261682C8|nr:hypothetical protein [uncultured Aquimarina sp.]